MKRWTLGPVVSLVKGEGIVFAKKGKSFDPLQIPKAIQGAGFTATEITVVAVGVLERADDGAIRLNVPGLNHAFLLVGGSNLDVLTKQKDLAGKRFRITGKLRSEKQVPALSVDDYQEVRSGN